MSSLSSVHLSAASFSWQAQTVSRRTGQAPPQRAEFPVPMPPVPPAEETAGSRLEERIGQLDPKLARMLRSLLAFLRQSDHEAADAFERSVGKVLHHLDQAAGRGSSAGPAVVPDQVRFQRIEFAFQASITEIEAQVGNGVQVSAQQIEVSFQLNFTQVLGQADPLVVDLNDNGAFDTTSYREGVHFDLLARGFDVQTATVAHGDAFLVLDRNGNGRIDDGSELFGDQRGAVDGFAELARLDDNADQRIDQEDEAFAQLRLFDDANRNGATDPGELSTLQAFRIQAFLLETHRIHETTSGNLATRAGSFLRNDGSRGRVGDVLLRYLA